MRLNQRIIQMEEELERTVQGKQGDSTSQPPQTVTTNVPVPPTQPASIPLVIPTSATTTTTTKTTSTSESSMSMEEMMKAIKELEI